MRLSMNSALTWLGRLAEQLGLALDLPEQLFAGLLDSAEIAAELEFGRD